MSKDNNVFKAMMQRIKHLEMNDAIVEMFTNQVKNIDVLHIITYLPVTEKVLNDISSDGGLLPNYN